MDSSDDEDRGEGAAAAAADDSQLDDDAMNALLEEEIAAAMQADSDALDDADDDAKQRGNEDAAERKEGGSRRRGLNGDLLDRDSEQRDGEQKDSGARKRPARGADDIKAGELDSDLEEPSEQPSTASAAGPVSGSASAAPQSDKRRRNNRANYLRREQRRKQLELEHGRIRSSLPSAAAHRRYDTFRRARLSHSTLKQLVQRVTDSNKVEGQLPAVLSAMGRVFVGQVVEEARRAMRAMGHSGSIRPMHLREAHRRLADRGDIVAPNCSDGRKRGLGVAGWRRDGQFFREMG